MAYRAAVRTAYDVALFIPGDAGASGRTHGHRYTVEVVLEADELDQAGFVADFDTVQSRLAGIARGLDHSLLNELPPFRDRVPSAEHQAEYIYRRLYSEIHSEYGTRVRLVKVRVIQEPGAWVEYEP